MTYSECQFVVETKNNHLSNVELIGYMDEARSVWYEFCISTGVEAVVVHLSTDFRKELFDQDQLNIRTQIARVGNTSFTLEQSVVDVHQQLVSKSEVVLTTIDIQTRQKVRVPDQVRELLQKDGTLPVKVDPSYCS
ncbi:acyl-CoA thioesterase [Alkalihalobacterium chitinilyticum]|uniref:Thioesterase family protein n=1 Tax=Alkalihalobacterium chitinilyticum TaxID=2980103 RepID=A0ABT5VD21_9BACI|nr:thioesterase family protein [Alkalihalobacterium chitinilyticum]MDE5413347.1 thioesterase family protein [Alkalihalobacterium chitinilyticum]